MARYNGHRNWNHWNVALWISGDAGLHTRARAAKRWHYNNDAAARQMLAELHAEGITHTPDGAPYSITTLRAAMAHL